MRESFRLSKRAEKVVDGIVRLSDQLDDDSRGTTRHWLNDVLDNLELYFDGHDEDEFVDSILNSLDATLRKEIKRLEDFKKLFSKL